MHILTYAAKESPVGIMTDACDMYLVAAAKDGDHQAYAELCRRHSKQILRTVLRITRNIGQCAQYCGAQHAKMLLRVYADSPEKFAAWVNKQKKTALQDFADNPAAAEGQAVFMHNACINCHTQVFNQLFTMHGTTMVFFVGMGILFGMGNYLVPLMIGARDMAFPRLNAFSFWATAFAGALLYFSILGGSGLYAAGQAPDVGWFAYAPLTARVFSPGHSTDYWTLSLLLSGIGSIGTAVNFSRNRSLNEMPWDDDESTPSPRVAISRDG